MRYAERVRREIAEIDFGLKLLIIRGKDMRKSCQRHSLFSLGFVYLHSRFLDLF